MDKRLFCIANSSPVMKLKIVGCLLLMFGIFTCSAQPILTAVTSIPVPGFSYQTFKNSQFIHGPSGSSQMWDFSGQVYTAEGTVSYAGCNSTNNCATFPGSNLVYHSTADTSSFSYYIASASSLSLNGYGFYNNEIFTDPDDVLRFPFTYGTSYADSFKYTDVNSMLTLTEKGSDSVSGDGWGTLKTPAGLFSNVLRIRHINTRWDSVKFNSGPVEVYVGKDTMYQWYDANHPDPLYMSIAIHDPANNISVSRYTFQNPTEIGTPDLGNTDWRLYPNPASGSCKVTVRLFAPSNIELSIVDLSGRIVYKSPMQEFLAGEVRINVPVEHIVPGVYAVRLRIDDRATIKKLIVE